MNIMFRNILSCLICLVLIASCEHSTSTQDNSVDIYGSWQWTKTEGGVFPLVTTPQSAGYTAKTVFKPEGIAQYFRNDTIINQYQFSIIKDTSGAQVTNLLHLKVTAYQPDQIINLQGNDSLVLSDYVSDGFSHFYVRIK
jgi:hypothetical protein